MTVIRSPHGSRRARTTARVVALLLPKAWAADATRCRDAGVPPEAQVRRQKWQLTLEELDRVRDAGVTFGLVLADAAYGSARSSAKA